MSALVRQRTNGGRVDTSASCQRELRAPSTERLSVRRSGLHQPSQPLTNMSASLSGRVGVKHFQTAPSIWCRCHSQGPRFSSGSALWPSHDGIRRMRRTNLQRRPCRKTYGRHQDSKRVASSIVLRGHRSTGRRNSGFLHVFYCAQLAVRYGMMSVTNVHWRHGRSCLLGRAERSSPKAAQRCAAGAGLDGERAHRAIIRAVAMRTTIRRSRSRRRRLLSCSSETRCHPPTCDA